MPKQSIIPSQVSAETAAWMRVQMTIAAARAVEPLQQRLESNEEWSHGLFVVLANIVPTLLKSHPELAAKVETHWREAAEKYQRITESGQQREGCDTADFLEARKIIYGLALGMQAWPSQQANSTPGRKKRA